VKKISGGRTSLRLDANNLLKRRRVADPFVYIRLTAVVISPWRMFRSILHEHPRQPVVNTLFAEERSTTTFRTILKQRVRRSYSTQSTWHSKDIVFTVIKALIDADKAVLARKDGLEQEGLCTFF
jgi:hypothetical protein